VSSERKEDIIIKGKKEEKKEGKKRKGRGSLGESRMSGPVFCV
jgi:hypothetical protein